MIYLFQNISDVSLSTHLSLYPLVILTLLTRADTTILTRTFYTIYNPHLILSTVNGSDVYMNSCLYGNGTSFVESLFEDFGE